jgi:MFS superfamily sulfate permease-like transporter
MAAFVAVVLTGAVRGVVIAIGLSIAVFVAKAWRPHATVLVRVDHLKGYHDAERHPEGRQVPGMVLYRFDAPLFFANAELFRTRVLALAAGDGRVPITSIVVTAEPITDIDATAAAMLLELEAELARRGVQLGFAVL